MLINLANEKNVSKRGSGAYKQAIAFEAKSTEKDTRFDLKNIAQHQLDYLEKAEKMGAICFFLMLKKQ